jgi:hypothetical protein
MNAGKASKIFSSSEMDSAAAESGRIHDDNLKNPPAIPEKTILCEIVATKSILPAGQWRLIDLLGQKMEEDDSYVEKMVSLQAEDTDSAEFFMAKLKAVKTKIEDKYAKKGYKVRFVVACPSLELVRRIKENLGVRALAFTKEEGANAVQPENVMRALRALDSEKIDRLKAVFKSITGKTTDKNDIDALAMAELFVLPAARIGINKVDDFNKIAEKYILSAA